MIRKFTGNFSNTSLAPSCPHHEHHGIHHIILQMLVLSSFFQPRLYTEGSDDDSPNKRLVFVDQWLYCPLETGARTSGYKTRGIRRVKGGETGKGWAEEVGAVELRTEL